MIIDSILVRRRDTREQSASELEKACEILLASAQEIEEVGATPELLRDLLHADELICRCYCRILGLPVAGE